MSWLGDKLRGLKHRIFGTTADTAHAEQLHIAAAQAEARALMPGRRQDQGPATKKYVKACFPRSIFTKKLTPMRKRYIQMIMQRLRPEQRAIAKKLGYDKGLYS